jgi:hypothetical protein
MTIESSLRGGGLELGDAGHASRVGGQKGLVVGQPCVRAFVSE